MAPVPAVMPQAEENGDFHMLMYSGKSCAGDYIAAVKSLFCVNAKFSIGVHDYQSFKVQWKTTHHGVVSFDVKLWSRNGCVGEPATSYKDMAANQCIQVNNWRYDGHWADGVILSRL